MVMYNELCGSIVSKITRATKFYFVGLHIFETLLPRFLMYISLDR